MSSHSKVSVCITSHNHGRFLRETVDSVLRQTYSHWELIVVDDASSDDSAEILRAYVAREPERVRVHLLQQNVGVSRAINLAVHESDGDYIAFLGSDDRMRESRLERQVDFLCNNPKVGAVCSLVELIDGDGNRISQGFDIFEREITNLRWQLIEGNFLNAPSFMLRRAVWAAVGEFNPALQYTQDYDYWLRVLDRYEIRRLADRLTQYRLHGDNLSVTSPEDAAFASRYETMAVIQRAIARVPLERLMGIDEAPGSEAWREAVVAAKLDLANKFMQLDSRLFGRPFLGLGQAYQLVLETLDLQPENLRAKMLLSSVYAALGDEPRSCGHSPIRFGEWAGTHDNRLQDRPTTAEDGATRDDTSNPTAAEAYREWIEKRILTAADGQFLAERMTRHWWAHPTIHLLTTFQPGQEQDLLLTLGSLDAQLYRGWGLSIIADCADSEGTFNAVGNVDWIELKGKQFTDVLNRAIADTSADWVGMIDLGDQFEPHGFFAYADYINLHPHWSVIYSDHDLTNAEGERVEPNFKPDINPELLRSTPYIGSASLFERRALDAVGGFRWLPGAEAYDALLRILEGLAVDAIGHIPDVLYHQKIDNAQLYQQEQVFEHARQAVSEHLARSRVAAIVHQGLLPGSHFIEYRHEQQPLVSIIVPTKDRLDLLKPCVESLLAKTAYPKFEVLIVDNNSSESTTLEFLDALEVGDPRVRVLRYPHPYNFAAINNRAAREAQGEYLLLLNNDTQIVQDSWLDRMVAHGQRPEVGIVGARLVFPDQRLQHAGVVLGMAGAAEHVHIGLPINEPGYMGRAQLVQNFSAVTAACLLIERSVYEAVGGLDEDRFKVLFNDVDLCLKVQKSGYKIVWTPYATVVHHGSSSLKSKNHQMHASREPTEAWAMFEKWLPEIANDPAYNRNLSLKYRDARIETDFVAAWNPAFRDRPRVLGFPVDSWGCGWYRVRAPLGALQRDAKAQVAILPEPQKNRVPQIAEMARMAPDVLLVQSFAHDGQIKALELYQRFFPELFMVFELDDLKTEMPSKSPKARTMYKDIRRRLRKALSLCGRMVVSTDPLKEAYGGLIDDIVVVPNYLESPRWDSARSQRRQGTKPRVGWVGAQQHHGDLALLREVVRATADEVEWVFMGMCLKELRPYTQEVHQPVPFDRYPEKLASLNLDLAVAPLEHHRFNEAKSNLHLLEYGVLGWPVVCTDIEPYRLENAPVTRVPNKPEAWIRAIRDHVNDLDAAARAGEQLRQWVLEHWMLEDHLDEWLEALTPAASQAQRVSAKRRA